MVESSTRLECPYADLAKHPGRYGRPAVKACFTLRVVPRGLTMKLALCLCIVALMGMDAPRLSAQTQVDPRMIVDTGRSYPSCTAASPTVCFDGKHPIVEPFSTGTFSFDFAYINQKKDLFELIIKITGVPEGTRFSCESSIWSDCKIQIPKAEKKDGDVDPPELITVTFIFSGEDATHPGFLPKFVPGQATSTFGVEELLPLSATPEPGSWILFATGIFAFALIRDGRKGSQATPLA